MIGPRLLGLDIGERRIGVAISDELGLVASPLQTILTSDDVLGVLADLVRKHAIGHLVIGLPISLNGREGPQAKQVREDAADIASALDIRVEFFDERLSSSVAEQALITQGVKKDKRRGQIDAIAAAVILQGYLDREKATRPAARP